MTNDPQVTKAIAAHSAWKARLRSIIVSGKSDVSVTTLCMDDQCEFGKWLKGPSLPAQLRASAQYGDVVRLHATFHQSAGRTASLALEGKKSEAEASMNIGGEFNKASSALINSLMAWH